MSSEPGLPTGTLNAAGLRIAIVVSRYNQSIGEALVEGASSALVELGIGAQGALSITWVPGAFELPLMAKRLGESSEFDAIICLGAVVRGDTPHFEFVSSQTAAGIMSVGLDLNLPVIFGVLTTDTFDQADERAGGPLGNKGRESAHVAVEMVQILRNLSAEAN